MCVTCAERFSKIDLAAPGLGAGWVILDLSPVESTTTQKRLDVKTTVNRSEIRVRVSCTLMLFCLCQNNISPMNLSLTSLCVNSCYNMILYLTVIQ